ncbi:MAG: hypothetical protein J5612_01740 [Paludibacteraceae bacterium]|nr:hypothetical protein [Paludibacteraceae bacterium]
MGNNEQAQWHWQEPNTAWRGVGIYHVTLTVTDRQPLLGTLDIPENDPKQARVEWSDLGRQVLGHLLDLPKRRPEIRIVSYCLMPDHMHSIWHVTKPMPTSILSVVRGFWQGEKKIGRAYSMSIAPHSMRENVHTKQEEHTADPLFHEMPFVRPLSRRGQLDTMVHYLMLNPQRLATKRLMPGYFRVQEDIEIAGRKYSGVGNVALLQAERFAPVHVRRTMVEEAIHGDDKRLRDYMNGCVLAARQGAVMVSPFISEKEKEVMVVLLAEEHPIIILADNGFRDYYKPTDGLFDAVAEGRVLILSPWEYDADKRHISRADCVALNGMAEEICNYVHSPELNSGKN